MRRLGRESSYTRTVASTRNLAIEELERRGLLLHADARLPSVSSIVAGEPVRGSWWGHPKSHEIFAVLEALGDSADATSVKLVNGKLTFVHRAIWPELCAVGSCDEDWQIRGLSSGARAVLSTVRERRSVRTDELRGGHQSYAKSAPGELEQRLLVHSRQVHTASGAHERILSIWHHWAGENSVSLDTGVAAAKERFEAIVNGLRTEFGGKAVLPWG